MRIDSSVALTRSAVRRALEDLSKGELVVAAVSGGADSLALAAALAFVAPRRGLLAGAVTVDHGMQPGSDQQAERAAKQAADLGLSPVEIVRVRIGRQGGPEAAARTARYRALDDYAERTGAATVLLAHTRDDQAETVLLGLARGSGARSLAGMPRRVGRYRRPFLDISREVTSAACREAGLEPWDDPMNNDLAFARARVRHQVLPALVSALGDGSASALARTADMLRADADALDGLAATALRDLVVAAGSFDTAQLALYPEAIRTRILRTLVLRAGAPPGLLAARHIHAVDALITDWHGQGPVSLPGGLAAERRSDRLHIS